MSALLSIELPFFALFLLYAYRTTPYKSLSTSPHAAHGQGGPLGIKAYIEAFLITDIISAFIRGPMKLVREQAKYSKEEDIALVGSNGSYGGAGGRFSPEEPPQKPYDPHHAPPPQNAYGQAPYGGQQTGYTGGQPNYGA